MVNGAYRGSRAILNHLDTKNFCVTITIDSVRLVNTFLKCLFYWFFLFLSIGTGTSQRTSPRWSPVRRHLQDKHRLNAHPPQPFPVHNKPITCDLLCERLWCTGSWRWRATLPRWQSCGMAGSSCRGSSEAVEALRAAPWLHLGDVSNRAAPRLPCRRSAREGRRFPIPRTFSKSFEKNHFDLSYFE